MHSLNERFIQRLPGVVRRHPVASSVLTGLALLLLGGALSVHIRFSRLVSERLAGGSLHTSSAIYAAPKLIVPGQQLTAAQIIGHLQRAGYTVSPDNPVGWYRSTDRGLEIVTGRESWFRPQKVLMQFEPGDSRISRIVMPNGASADRFWLEPELLTNVMDSGRGRRRPVVFSQFPKHLVDAVTSVEDKRFFQHSGLDLIRVARAAYVDIREGRKEQGASTITMQLARSFWLDQDKNWKRKISEVFIAAELERRFTKEEVFQLYANEVYLGRRGSFSIHGFGEAAQAYFGKDVRRLTLPEAAMLAGMIQRPSYYNPFRYPDRVKQRRDLALTLMYNNGAITQQQLNEAVAEPIELTPGEIESTEAPYFADLVEEQLQDKFNDWDFAHNAFRIYTTLDLDLQRLAFEAVRDGMQEVDKAVRAKRGKKLKTLPQVAMVVLDPHTGAIKALVGGRNYQESQLNRVMAKRQPGSSFKPFVYAAALDQSLRNNKNIITAATTVVDEPTTFTFNNQAYQPANFGDRYLGTVTVRKAVMNSLNIPTIKVAEQAGFDNVIRLARASGIQAPLQPTPSLALGSYEVPPLEVAEAYTTFSNGGMHTKRFWMESIRDHRNREVFRHQPEQNQALDPRVAAIMTNILEDVIRGGTAAAVRQRGFKLPAAGKTGTARDGWFAGYTSKLLAVVWVGFDDYSDLDLEGSKSALPVWTNFMKKAHELPQYRGAEDFKLPEGVVRVSIDADTGMQATDQCLNVRSELFVKGTLPKRCDSDHLFLNGDPNLPPDPADTYRTRQETGGRSVFGRMLGIFR